MLEPVAVVAVNTYVSNVCTAIYAHVYRSALRVRVRV